MTIAPTKIGAALALAAAVLLTAAVPADGPSLDDCMHGLKSNMRQLAKAVPDEAKRQVAIDALREMQVWTLQAKTLTPPLAEERAKGEERDAFMLGYQVEMAKLLGKLADMEVDLLEGRTDEVRVALHKDLMTLRDDAHDKYQ